MNAILLLLGGIAIVFINSVLRGYVLACLWAWFIVSTFGLPQIGIVQAIGLSMTASLITHVTDTGKQDPDKGFLYLTIASITTSAFMLLCGFIVKQFI